MAVNLSEIEPSELAAAADTLLSGHVSTGAVCNALTAIPGFVYGELRNSGRSVIGRWANEGDFWRSLCKVLETIRETANKAKELLLCFATNPRLVTIGDDSSWQLVNANVNRGLFGYEFRLADNLNHFHRISPFAFIAQNRTFEKFLQEFAEQHGLTLERARAGAVVIREFDCKQFRIELQQPSKAQRLFRDSPLVPIACVTRESIKELAELLSEYMLRSVQPDGRMTYFYYPSQGSEDRTRDNSVRQWMATRALDAIWQRSNNQALVPILRRNITHNLQAMYREEGALGLIVEGDKVKLGATALAAMALNESPFAQEFSTQYDRLTSTVLTLWTDSGQFRTFYRPAGRMDNQNFYPGEALQFWSKRIASGDKSLTEPFWKSFEFYQRWHLANRNPAFIPWHTQAYWIMWKLTSDERLSRLIFEMNDWLLDIQQWETAPYPDCQGRFYDPHRPFGPPHASSIGVFLEGLVDAFAMAKALKDEHRAEQYRTVIVRGLRSIAQLTFKDDADMFYVTQRDRLRGGVRTCEYDNAVRVDNSQHCLMAIQKILDVFSEEDFVRPPARIERAASTAQAVNLAPPLNPRESGPLWTAKELATVTKAHWYGSMPDITGFAYLPRRVKAGDLFVALNYEGVDHHQNVTAAFARGASAALVSRRPPGVAANAPLLLTSNVPQALMRLGAAARSRIQGKIIGITGRAGKTFTKDTLAYLLGKQAPTQKTEGNDNDFTGVAITLARAHPNVPFQVIEMSMAHLGDDIANSVRPKAKLVRPHVAIITCVSGSRLLDERYRTHHSQVAATKAQIFEGLLSGGTAIMNRDDDQVFCYLREQAKVCGVEHLVTFGQHPDSDIRLLDARRGQSGFDVDIHIRGKPFSFAVGINGSHLVHNTLAALAAIDALGADLEQALTALPEVHESPGRGNRYVVETGGGTAILLDYTRNASMPATHASLEVLAEMTIPPGGRCIAVLGDMTELEGDSAPFHRDIAAEIERLGIDLVFAVGENMKHMFDALPAEKRGGYRDSSNLLASLVKERIHVGDVILAQGWAREL